MRLFIALSTRFCLSVSALLIPYSVHFLQYLQLIVAVRNIFLRTLSSKRPRSWHNIVAVSSLYSPVTHTACRLYLLGGVQVQEALSMRALVYLKGCSVLVFITKPVRITGALRTSLCYLCVVKSGTLMVSVF